MSKKSRERREKHKIRVPEDYYNNGVFEIARFGKNVLMKNNMTLEQQVSQTEYLCNEYPKRCQSISQKIVELKEKISSCDPYGLLLHIAKLSTMSQLNVFSEIEHSSDSIMMIHALEYVQSILITTKNSWDSSVSTADESQIQIFDQILVDFEKLHQELQMFLPFWAAYIQKNTSIDDECLINIVESQYMYWVRGNRYQIFELEPLKTLLFPHNDILFELFGVTINDIIRGLEKLRYSLSQEYADSMMYFGKEFDSFIAAVDSGLSPEVAHESAKERTQKIVGKLFGSDLNNVKKVTGWDDRFIDILSAEVNELSSFWKDDEFSGWPLTELPVTRKPFIKIEGVSYCFLYYALFDNVYRNIQKAIMRQKPDYLETWKERQTESSEKMVADLFLKMLPGAEVHISNYYPVKNSLKQMNENDIIIKYENYLFIIEVKAGSFPISPPITDFESHIKAYQKLAEEADSQCHRTREYIESHPNAQFYTKEKVPTFQIPEASAFDDIFTFSVTVENFNEFAAKAEKLSVIKLKEKTVVISIDDLLVYSSYFDSPVVFLHYLKQRKAAMDVNIYHMNDEFDHLGLYIDRNCYALNPSQYGDVKNVFWNGFRQPLDEYFGLLYCNPQKAIKPVQNIPKEIKDIISFVDKNITPEGIQFAIFLLNLCTEGKEDLADQIQYALKRQQELRYMVPVVAFGEIKYCAFVSIPGIKNYTVQESLDYTLAAASRDENIPVMCMLLEYDSKGELVLAKGIECKFSDVPPNDIERIKHLGNIKAKHWVESHKRAAGKIGRNDYCPCGSGKKYKACCIEKS